MPANGGVDVSPAVGLCAYRIVQEALSNAGRHAPGSRVVVNVERDSGELRLDVVNGPPPLPRTLRPNGGRPGHGIAGMRERVTLLGGSITAGPRADGGFAVSRRSRLLGGAAAVTDPITCLIADDQAMVREGFGALLAAQPDLVVVGQAADGADAVRQARELHPDVILMDVRMPVMDGLEATRRILEQVADEEARPRVLMLTTFDLDEYVYDALRAGASGFLLKDAPAARARPRRPRRRGRRRARLAFGDAPADCRLHPTEADQQSRPGRPRGAHPARA